MEGENGRTVTVPGARLMRRLKLSASLVALCVGLPCRLFSQAWLSPKDQGTVTLLYQYGFDRYHAMSQREAVDVGHTSLQALMVDVDYSLTDRLAVRLGLPYIKGKYTGSKPHLLVRRQPDTAVALDNGSYHGGPQDVRFDVRYNVSRKTVMITPFFQVSVPSHSYPTLGHAAVGTDQREYRIGVNLGGRLGSFLPRAYVQGKYAFGVVEQVAQVAPKRSYAEFQFGYLLSRQVSIQASTVGGHSHNGIPFINGLFPDDIKEEQYLNHDRISRQSLLDVGISASYAITPKTNLFIGWGRSLTGANTHLRALVLTVGVTKSFTARPRDEKASVLPSTESKRVLVCTCAKSK